MAKPTRTLTVNFVGRTDQLDKAYKRVNKGSQNMSATLTRGLRTGMTAFAGIGAAAAGFVALAKPMVDMASNVNEAMSKNKQLFGESAKAVTEFAETAAENLGLSRRETLIAVGDFGALTSAMKMTEEEGSHMSMRLVELASDLASFHDTGVDQALTALAAGLRGENEPLRKFGVLLDAATLKTKALEMGLIENTKSALDPANKALAAYEVILQASIDAHGDFQRTSDGLAGQQKKLTAQFADLQEAIGQALLHVFRDFTSFLVSTAIPNLQKFVDVAKDEGFLVALDKAGDAIARWQLGNWDEILGLGGAFFKELIDDISFLGDSINNVFVGLGDSFANMWNETNWKPIWEQDFSVAMNWLNSAWDAASGLWDKIFGGPDDTGTPAGSIMGDIRRDTGQASSGMAGFNPNVGPDPLFGMGAMATDEEIAAEIDQFEEMAKAAAATVKAPPRTPGATLLDPRAAAFQSASLAGGAHTINVNINAPAVTTAEVNAAVANGFKNDAMLLEQLYFI